MSGSEEEKQTKGGDDGKSEEIETIKKACDYMHSFIETVIKRGYDNLPKSSQDEIKKIEDELKQLSCQPKVSTNGKEKLAKTKIKQETTGDGMNEYFEKESKKNREGVKREETSTGSSSETSSETSSDEKTDDEESAASNDDERKKKSKKRVKKDTDVDILRKLLERIDNRRIPDIEKYDHKNGESLKEYLKKFEKYCDDNIKGDISFWIPELEKHLSGRILQTFSAVKDCRDDYKSLKKKLIKWDEQTKKTRKAKARKGFETMKYDDKEDLFVYSNRLQQQFKLAFPKKKTEKSRVLQEKFISTVPKSFRKIINAQIMNTKMNNQKVLWSSM